MGAAASTAAPFFLAGGAAYALATFQGLEQIGQSWAGVAVWLCLGMFFGAFLFAVGRAISRPPTPGFGGQVVRLGVDAAAPTGAPVYFSSGGGYDWGSYDVRGIRADGGLVWPGGEARAVPRDREAEADRFKQVSDLRFRLASGELTQIDFVDALPDPVTVEWLVRRGACDEGVVEFLRVFPSGEAPLTPESYEIAESQGLNWAWLVQYGPIELYTRWHMAEAVRHVRRGKLEAEWRQAMREIDERQKASRRRWLNANVFESRLPDPPKPTPWGKAVVDQAERLGYIANVAVATPNLEGLKLDEALDLIRRWHPTVYEEIRLEIPEG